MALRPGTAGICHVPPTCLPPPRPPRPPPPNSFRLSVQFYVQSLGHGRCKPRFISSPPRQEARAVHQASRAQRNSGRGVAFRGRCLVGPGRRQPAPQNARWKGRPPQLHVLSSLRFLLLDLEPLSDAGCGPGLPQAISVLGCKPVAGPGTGKGQESHRRVCPHVTRGRETVWEGTGSLSTNLCEGPSHLRAAIPSPKRVRAELVGLCVSAPLPLERLCGAPAVKVALFKPLVIHPWD